MPAQRFFWIVWPAFLVAALTEMLVFAFVEPEALLWRGEPLELSRQGIYTLAFFAFWALAAVASSLTTLLALSPFAVLGLAVEHAGQAGAADALLAGSQHLDASRGQRGRCMR